MPTRGAEGKVGSVTRGLLRRSNRCSERQLGDRGSCGEGEANLAYRLLSREDNV